MGAELIVVTGDHAWGPQPAEVLDRLTSLGDRAVLIRGNADRELLEAADDPSAAPVARWRAAQLHPSHRALLEAMPEQLTVDVEGFGSVCFCHATPRNDEEVVLVDSRLERWDEALAGLSEEVRTVVCGHTHMPYVRLVDGRLIVNAGSVGMPYGRGGAHWALLSGGNVTIGRTPLDPDALADQVIGESNMPGVAEWAERCLRTPFSDVEVIRAIGPRYGRC